MPSKDRVVPFFTAAGDQTHDLPLPKADTLPTELPGPVIRVSCILNNKIGLLKRHLTHDTVACVLGLGKTEGAV